MSITSKRIVKIDEVAHLIPTKSGATFSQLWQVFYYTRMLKYVSYRHYVSIKRSFNKICTYKNLQELCELGYLKSPQHEVYCATNKVLPVLQEVGYNLELLPSEPVGAGDINELNNTDVFVQAVKSEHFFSLLYPQFKWGTNDSVYLIPDALLVQLDTEEQKYKLTFLEVEAKKPDWENYIEHKRNNYLKLSRDVGFFNYWNRICEVIGLPAPDISTLKFSVQFIGTKTKQFEDGFVFVQNL